ncbi:EboA domain-containing protein [Kitasatospora sp. GP82]|uniref:EboA domain-containing protein n=1 Tax=Kitasatospora sp. GP82 TaxID=3035089 RepID=UPI0024735BCD|nr:EboA domain-containing protein [Kitasatospora sp. GP82]
MAILQAPENGWPAGAERRIRERPAAIHKEFPLAGQAVGRVPVQPETDPQGLVFGTVDDQARARLLAVLAEVLPAGALETEVERLYRHGDDAERRGVLRALSLLPDSSVRLGLELVADGLRTNDPRLIAAAMGPFAAEHLDQAQWRQGVVKCLFAGVTLSAVADLVARTDSELLRMARDLAEERRAAGREISPDLRALLGMTVLMALVPPRAEDDRR